MMKNAEFTLLFDVCYDAFFSSFVSISPVDESYEFFFSAMLSVRKINLFTAVGMLQVHEYENNVCNAYANFSGEKL